MMINLLRPKYIIPTIGEYRHQYGVKQLALQMNYKEDQIFLLDNGDAVNLSKGKEPFVSRNEIKTSEILIDGTAVGDVNDFVMRDRELLAADGVLLIIANINAKTKESFR